jgi:MarR family transcriptional regulator, organic hydroperoxide resistance regulator
MSVPAPPQPHLMQLLTRAERLLGRRLLSVLTGEGCSLEAWRVISLLADGAGHPMTELAERAALPPGTLTKLMDGLVEDNLVYRRVDELDRRRIRAYLSPRGRRFHQRISHQVDTSLATTLPTDSSEREMLEQLLTRLIDSLEGCAILAKGA